MTRVNIRLPETEQFLSDTDHSFLVSTTGRDYDRSTSVSKYVLVTAVESYMTVKFEANIICISV